MGAGDADGQTSRSHGSDGRVRWLKNGGSLPRMLHDKAGDVLEQCIPRYQRHTEGHGGRCDPAIGLMDLLAKRMADCEAGGPELGGRQRQLIVG